MQSGLIAIYIGGVMHLGWAVFHLFFPRVFKWPKALAQLDPVNRNIMHIINLCLTFYFFCMAYLCLAFGTDLLTPGLGRKLIAIMGGFWFLRFGLQLKFFRLTHPISILMSCLFILTAAVYFYPLVKGAG